MEVAGTGNYYQHGCQRHLKLGIMAVDPHSFWRIRIHLLFSTRIRIQLLFQCGSGSRSKLSKQLSYGTVHYEEFAVVEKKQLLKSEKILGAGTTGPYRYLIKF